MRGFYSSLLYEKCGLVKDDDWTNTYGQLDSWKQKWLVTYFQVNDHKNEDLKNAILCLSYEAIWCRSL